MAARTTKPAPEAEQGTTDEPELLAGALPKVPETIQPSDMNIFQRIAAISREAGALAPESKGGVPFPFRGVDGTVNHLTPLLNKYGVFVVPAGGSHLVTEREILDKQGNPTGRIVKTSQIDQSWNIYGPDGFGFTATTYGLADDFADRSTAQAQSVAYRIALLQIFHLPTQTKEPEEAGEDTQAQIAKATSGEDDPAPRGPKAVEAAKEKQAAPAPTGIARLQAETKALGRKLGVNPDELNALGARLSGGVSPDVWFNDPLIMEQIRDDLKARTGA